MGTIVIKWYEDNGYTINESRIMTFEKNESDYHLDYLTCNVDSNASFTVGSGTLGITFDNPLTTEEKLNSVYKKVRGFAYRGASLKTLGDIRLDPWDIVTVEELGKTYKVPVMNITQEYDGGLAMTITAYGKTETETETDYKGPSTKLAERTYAEMMLTKELVAKKVDAEWVKANTVQAETVVAINNELENIRNNYLKSNIAEIKYATIESLKGVSGEFEKFKTNDFTAITGKVNDLTVGVEKVNTLMFGSASGGSLTTEFSNSVISLIGDAQIKSAMIESIDAKKITSLDVNTTSVNIHSESGLSRWKDNTIVISDGTRTRVQIGKDANADYNIYVWDKAGNLMFDALGLTEKGVQREIIRNDMIKEDADISASKLDIGSLFDVINNDGSHTLKSSKIYVDSDKQTLDVSFKAITTKTDTAVTAANKAEQNAGMALSTANSADTKAQSVINRANAGEFKGADGKNFNWNLIKYDYIEAFASEIDKSEYIKNGKVICEGTNVNAGIKIDSVNCYESSTQYVLSGYVTILSKTCINFFIYNGKKHTSVEGKITTVSNQYTTLNQSFTSLKATVNSNTTAISKKADNSTVTEINNRVTTLTADLSGIKQSISATYVTKTEYAKEIDRLGDNINNVDDKASAAQDWCQTIEDNITDHYSTTVQMNNAITQAVSAESNSIKLEVSGTYATKNDINNLQIGGVNRFIKSTATINKYITATGTITAGGNYWDLTDYIDVSQWTHYIASGWTNLGNAPATCFYDSNKKFISGVAGNNTSARHSLPIPTGAAYMRFSYAHVDTDKLKIEKGTKATDYSPAPEDVNAKFNNYATTASLSAYIAKTDTGALKSCIEAIADDINLTAGGSINISGNKSVNIRGNTFSLDSSGTKISNTGYLQTVNAKLGEWNVDSKAIYCETADKVYTAYLQNPDYVVGNTRENAWVYSVQKNGIATFYVTSEGDLYCRCFSTPYTTYQPNYRWATYENSLNTTLFIRTFHGPCLIIANVSIWTDDTSDYGTIKCGLYLDGYCVTENQHRLETTNAIELSAGATYVWYFSDNEAHTLSGIGGSTKNGKKTITYSVQALFNNDVRWGTGQ